MTLLRSARLTLRPLQAADLAWITSLSNDSRVMVTLGGIRSPEQVNAWLERELTHLDRYGYCRNVVALENEPIGLVGLSRSDFDSGVVPGIEIAWQLAFAHWGHGYATEAAQRVLGEAFTSFGLSEVIAITSLGNTRSRGVMERLGMRPSPDETFEHPTLAPGDPGRTHVLYRITRAEHLKPA